MSQNVPFFDAPSATTRGSCKVTTILRQKYIDFTLKKLTIIHFYNIITSLIRFFILITPKIHQFEEANMKPKSIRAAIQMMLPEVEEMLSLGVSREDVFKVVSERFHIANVNVRSFDTALYRARVKRSRLEKSTTLSCRKKEDQNNTHSQEIIGKEFFEKINDSFDPNKFMDKY
ncbi:plasmid stabilization protein StbA [Candidatus Hamiltonella defensa]|nr:plasmid stabilization protein StbA [Candidatus Hamiltonella defensa]ATW31812.1 hypothetical protein BJP42_05315 [Candidatus Hamiltonella defensa]